MCRPRPRSQDQRLTNQGRVSIQPDKLGHDSTDVDRKEHESVVGVDADSGNATDLYDDEDEEDQIGRSFGGHSRRHTVSDGLTKRTTDAAGDGVRTVAVALDAVVNDALKVLPEIASGFTVELTATGIRTSLQRKFTSE